MKGITLICKKNQIHGSKKISLITYLPHRVCPKMWIVFEEVGDMYRTSLCIKTRLNLSTERESERERERERERTVFKMIVMKNNLSWLMGLLSL